jgi:hypothetical protein
MCPLSEDGVYIEVELYRDSNTKEIFWKSKNFSHFYVFFLISFFLCYIKGSFYFLSSKISD